MRSIRRPAFLGLAIAFVALAAFAPSGRATWIALGTVFLVLGLASKRRPIAEPDRDVI